MRTKDGCTFPNPRKMPKIAGVELDARKWLIAHARDFIEDGTFNTEEAAKACCVAMGIAEPVPAHVAKSAKLLARAVAPA